MTSELQLSLTEGMIPSYLKLEGDRLYWSYASEAGTNRPLDHLLEDDAAFPDVETVQLQDGMTVEVISIESPRYVDPKRILDNFLRIKDGDDVLRFAKRYGVLELCAKGDPMKREHRRPFRSEDCFPEGWPSTPWHERVGDWLRYVNGANAILRIAAALDLNETSMASDWEQVVESCPGYFTDPTGASLQVPNAQRGLIEMAIQIWVLTAFSE